MGFLDSFLGEDEGEKSYSAPKDSTAFRISMNFVPLRLSAMKSNKVDLLVRVTNISDDEHMLSVDVHAPRSALIGFDRTCINKAVEKRVGKIAPGETKEVAIPVWGTHQTKAHDIPLDVKAYAHYLDYDKVLSQAKKRTVLRIV